MISKFKQSNSGGYTEVFAWGDDQYGQLGVSGKNNSKNYPSPRCCSFNVIIHQISCGDQHSAFIAANGYIYCMGSNDEGRLGLSQRDIKYSYSPCLVETLSRYKAVKVMCGWGHTIALVENGEVFTWGYGADGQLGNNNPNSQYTPQFVDFSHINDVLNTTVAKDIACGGRHSFVIMENSKACCFGCSEQGQLGTGSINNEIIPCVLDTIQENIISIACGHSHTLFLTENQQIYSTGSNSFGELGVGHKKSTFLPMKIMILENIQVKKIAASNFSAAITERDELYLWGSFGLGESVFPQKIAIKNKISNVSLGNKYGVFSDSLGILYGWGSNSNGELAQGDYDSRMNISQIITLQNKKINDFSCGGNFVIALGNTINKRPEENIANSRDHLEQKNNNSLDYFEMRKAKSQHSKNNSQHTRSLSEFKEDAFLNFKKNPQSTIRYLTNEEIKNRQKASLYESPNRITDREFEYVPGANCDTQRTNNSPLTKETTTSHKNQKYYNNFQKNSELKLNNNETNNNYQINIYPNESDFSSSKNQTNSKKERTNEFNVLNKEVIKSRQINNSNYKESKEPGYETYNSRSKQGNLNLNLEGGGDFFYEKEKIEETVIEKNNKARKNNLTNLENIQNSKNPLKNNNNIINNNMNDLQAQQIEMFHIHKREIENLRNDQQTLQEKYLKLERNFFEIEESLNHEKQKNLELAQLYEEEQDKNRNYLKEISDREQMLEKIEFMNHILQEKEQELLEVRNETAKKEKYFEETLKNIKNQYENQITIFQNDLNSCSNQIEKLRRENLNLNEEKIKKDDFFQKLAEEKKDLTQKIINLEDVHKNDLIKIKKMSQEINSFYSLEQENTQMKTLLEKKDIELTRLNNKINDLTEKNDYLENILNRDQRRLEHAEKAERELNETQGKIMHLEKLLTQKDSEIEQLKQMNETFSQKNRNIYEKNRVHESFQSNKYYENYEDYSNYQEKESLSKKDRSITPNPSIKKAERTDLSSIPSIENKREYQDYNPRLKYSYNYERKFESQENKVENKERAVINFNNSLNNSVVFNSNLNDIKAKLSDLHKNKNALEKRMQDFELRLKESKK